MTALWLGMRKLEGSGLVEPRSNMEGTLITSTGMQTWQRGQASKEQHSIELSDKQLC